MASSSSASRRSSGNIRPACRAEGCEAVEEKRVRIDNALVGQRLQDGKRLLEPALPDQRLRSGSDGFHGSRGGRRRCFIPAPGGNGKETGRLRHPGRQGRILIAVIRVSGSASTCRAVVVDSFDHPAATLPSEEKSDARSLSIGYANPELIRLAVKVCSFSVRPEKKRGRPESRPSKP